MAIYFSEKVQKENATNFKNISICGNCKHGEFAYYLCTGICRSKKYIFNSDSDRNGKIYKEYTYINISKYPILECDYFEEGSCFDKEDG